MNRTEKRATLKSMRADSRYIRRFNTKGNRKLVDSCEIIADMDSEKYERIAKFVNDPENGIFRARFSQFNLPAKITCPFASDGCKKFCYAKRDERYPSVRLSREENLSAAKDPRFSENMIYTIETELKSGRFNRDNTIMVLRIHESGDFFNAEYLKAWIRVFDHFSHSTKVVFEFYSKCFKFFLGLDNEYTAMLRNAMESGNVGFTVSIDDSMTADQRMDALKTSAKFPKANFYYCAEADVIAKTHIDHECKCENCASCGECVFTNGKMVGVVIH